MQWLYDNASTIYLLIGLIPLVITAGLVLLGLVLLATGQLREEYNPNSSTRTRQGQQDDGDGIYDMLKRYRRGGI